MSKNQLIAGVVALGIVLASSWYYLAQPQETLAPTLPPTTSPTSQTAVVTPLSAVRYTGTILAGTTSPLIDFNQTDFETATRANKVVVLYFYANWCPICREEFPKMQAAFNNLSSDQIVGFRVNFNDNETDDAEKALAREHGVAYQHTKVILRNNTQLVKSPETWEESRYLTEINKILGTR